MYSFELKTKQDIIDFANGCCFFGCGGGGDPEAGIKALSEVLEQGKCTVKRKLQNRYVIL